MTVGCYMNPHKAPDYFVLWSDGMLGGFQHADILMCAIAENRLINPVKTIWVKTPLDLQIVYKPITIEQLREIAWPTNAPIHLDNAAASFA